MMVPRKQKESWILDEVEVHVYCIVYRPVGSAGELQWSRSGSVRVLRWDSARLK